MTNFEDQIKRLKTEEQEPDPEKYIQFFGTFWTVKFIYLMIFLGTFLLVGFVSCLLRPTVISEKKQPFPYTQQAIPSTPSMPEVRNITMGDGAVYVESGNNITIQTFVNAPPVPTTTPIPTQCQLVQDPQFYSEIALYNPTSPSWIQNEVPGWPMDAVTNQAGSIMVLGISQDHNFLMVEYPGIGQGWTLNSRGIDLDPEGCIPPELPNPFPDPCVLRRRGSAGLFDRDGDPLLYTMCSD